jgi:alpha-beta hydrolase superfamily lysophospholipase
VSRLTVRAVAPAGEPRALAVVLHGGRVRSDAATRPWQLAAVRMLPFAAALRRQGARDGLVVAVVRYRARGWNMRPSATAPDPLEMPPRAADVVEALNRLTAQFGPLPIALVGHSMGGRAALRAAGHQQVRAVVGLAPWVEAADPYQQLADRDVLLVHGSADRITDPGASRRLAELAEAIGARASYIEITGDKHAMLHRPRLWHQLAARYVGAVLLGQSAVGQSSSGEAANLVQEAALGGLRATYPTG